MDVDGLEEDWRHGRRIGAPVWRFSGDLLKKHIFLPKSSKSRQNNENITFDGLKADWKMIGRSLEDDWRRIGDQGKVFLVIVNCFFFTEFDICSPKWRKNGF